MKSEQSKQSVGYVMYCRRLIVNILLLYIILVKTKRYRVSLFEKRTITEVTNNRKCSKHEISKAFQVV